MSPQVVSDPRSHAPQQVANAGRALARSPKKGTLFAAIYRGKRSPKSVDELAASTGWTRKQVLDVGRLLAKDQLVDQVGVRGQVGYGKDSFLDGKKRLITRLAQSAPKLVEYASRSGAAPGAVVVLRVPLTAVDAREVKLEELDSFARVREAARVVDFIKMPEERFRQGLQNVLAEHGRFRDWPGEQSDLFTTELVYKRKRLRAAFALKGPGRRGKLTPAGMGRHADQIQRLFAEPAELFIVQYWGQVDASLHQQIRTYALARSYTDRRRVLFCVIDGHDSARLIKSYPEEFK